MNMSEEQYINIMDNLRSQEQRIMDLEQTMTNVVNFVKTTSDACELLVAVANTETLPSDDKPTVKERVKEKVAIAGEKLGTARGIVTGGVIAGLRKARRFRIQSPLYFGDKP